MERSYTAEQIAVVEEIYGLVKDRQLRGSDGVRKLLLEHFGIVGKKWCSKCRRFHPTVSFGANERNPDGRHHVCRSCMAQYRAGGRLIGGAK